MTEKEIGQRLEDEGCMSDWYSLRGMYEEQDKMGWESLKKRWYKHVLVEDYRENFDEFCKRVDANLYWKCLHSLETSRNCQAFTDEVVKCWKSQKSH